MQGLTTLGPATAFPAGVTQVLAVQRAAGNRAVGTAIAGRSSTVGGTSAGTTADQAAVQREPVVQRQPGLGGSWRRAMDQDRQRNREIQSGQRPQGIEIMRLPDWDFLPQRDFDKIMGERLEELTLFTVPIPQLGVRVDLRASAEASLGLHAGYSGALRNIQVGLDSDQAMALRVMGTDPSTLAALAPFARRVHGMADLDVGGDVGLTAAVHGRLDAVGRVATLEIARLGFGLQADGSAHAGLRFGGRIYFSIDRGDLTLKIDKAALATFALHFALKAYIEASLLGFKWKKDWKLATADLHREWRKGATLSLQSAGPPSALASNLNFGNEQLQLADLARSMFTAATTGDNLEALNQHGQGGGSGGGAGGGGGGGAGGGPSAPTGRTQADPIPMTWYKSPGAYPPSIVLGANRYFLTEPDYVEVPNTRGLADLRREAETDNGRHVVRIGVDLSGRNYPTLGRVWPRTRVGAIRGGDKQDQFRRLLAHHGYSWGSSEADHVRDLQWAGRDAYDNLWPLERSRNNAANQILDQPVTYQNSRGQVLTVPLSETPRNLYFRIDAYG
jgi:hypothetical protein